jgi:hypothetical protein
MPFSAPGITSPSVSPEGNYIQPLPTFHDSSFPVDTTRYGPVSSIQAQASYPPRKQPADLSHSVSRHSSVTPTHQRPPRNKASSLFLHANGMTPFSVKVDALAHPSTQMLPPFTLRIKLCVPTMNDPRAPPTFHGFLAGVALDSVWSASARCTTKVYENNVIVADDTGLLSITHISVGTVNAVLPESPLTRCRWLNHVYPVTITQEIVVDDETLLFVIYELDRRNANADYMPSATLLGYQKYRAGEKSNSPMATVSPSPSTNLPPHATPYGRPPPHHSLPYTIPPMRYASSSGLNF